MSKVQLNNSNLLAYFNAIEELKNHPSIEEYRTGYRKLRDDDHMGRHTNMVSAFIVHLVKYDHAPFAQATFAIS
ncbi:DUF4756 family protein [Citrobacter sp. Cf081]|uniref:DUF4756 family protein n=1 Tax=Citrobacter sp. Cf081 TaxID=2985052 RepID=UPI0025757F76|nr:DUF4756 family protein [Citrobacter sp. Cf081]MDM3241741.1 DUF4756 family protein [Citrobacter sp. Cf081]